MIGAIPSPTLTINPSSLVEDSNATNIANCNANDTSDNSRITEGKQKAAFRVVS